MGSFVVVDDKAIMGRRGVPEKMDPEKLHVTATCVSKVTKPNSVVEGNLIVGISTTSSVATCYVTPVLLNKIECAAPKLLLAKLTGEMWMCVSVFRAVALRL